MKISELLPEKKRIYDVRNIFLDSDKNDKNHINNMYNRAIDDCTTALTEAVKRGYICVDVPKSGEVWKIFTEINGCKSTGEDCTHAKCVRYFKCEGSITAIIKRLRRGV